MFKRKKKAQKNTDGNQSYWAYVARQFKKNKRALFSLYFVIFLAIIALFADFIANEKPIICKYEGKTYMPVLKQYAVGLGLAKWPEAFKNGGWKEKEYDFAIWPIIPYLPNNLDYDAQWASPTGRQICACECTSVLDDECVESNKCGNNKLADCNKASSCTLKVIKKTPNWKEGMAEDEVIKYCKKQEYSIWRHWLGTDDIGRDVAAGMIHGTRIAFMVGIIAMGIACIIGIFLGACAGYFGDTGLELSRGSLFINIFAFFIAFFYAFYSRSYIMSDAFGVSFGKAIWAFFIGILIFLAIMAIANIIALPLNKIPFLGKKVAFPVDIAITRIIEVINSIPLLVLILAIVAIAKPSIFLVMAVIGTVRWTGIARFIRAELLRVRRLEYVEAANALGFSQMRTMFRHAIPNSLSPVFIAVAFGIASAILIESFLSFLGLGVPAETITWGKMLAISRTNASAWWFAIFPGLAIFITVTLFNLIGEGLTDALDPRLKQ